MEDKDYEQKKRECWEKFCKENRFDLYDITSLSIFNYAFNCGYNLSKQDNDAEQEEMLTNGCISLYPDQEEVEVNLPTIDDRRLNIAAMILSGLLASGKDKHPVKRALELTDSLIAEGRKGYRPKSPKN